jgi:hypothetical protein
MPCLGNHHNFNFAIWVQIDIYITYVSATTGQKNDTEDVGYTFLQMLVQWNVNLTGGGFSYIKS